MSHQGTHFSLEQSPEAVHWACPSGAGEIHQCFEAGLESSETATATAAASSTGSHTFMHTYMATSHYQYSV